MLGAPKEQAPAEMRADRPEDFLRMLSPMGARTDRAAACQDNPDSGPAPLDDLDALFLSDRQSGNPTSPCG